MSRACNHLGMRNLITYHLSATFECKIVISSAYWGKIKRGKGKMIQVYSNISCLITFGCYSRIVLGAFVFS